jgi:hypothetical protein
MYDYNTNPEIFAHTCMPMATKAAGIVQKRKAHSGTLTTVRTVSIQHFFFALLYFEFSLERACTFHKRLKLVIVVTVLSIVTALRRKSVLVVMGDAKGAVSSSFRAHYLLLFSCFVDIHVSSHS